MDLKRSYFEDIKLFESGVVLFWSVVLLALLIAFPLFAKTYYIYIASLLLINIIVAIGLNLLVGYTGQVSLGHAGFLAIGAYTSVLLMLKLGFPFLVALPLAGLVSALFGFILGLPALRMEGPYLAIATLGFGISVEQILGLMEKVTGGRMGLETPPFRVFGHTLKGDLVVGSFALGEEQQIYFLIMIVTVIMTFLAINLVRSRIGRAFIAIRDSDIAAESMGVNLTYYKTLAFAVSAFFVGVAGALQAHMITFIAPVQYNLIQSIYMLAMVVVGGLGSILGSILGAILFTMLPQLLAELGWLNSVITGAIMVLIIVFEPLGLRGRWIKIKIYWKMWPF
ncbi:MAG: branched-chain amino acid ABC transporter permease [Deltaproteobacteria bacterium]|nr:branched-chain amino acid ABC transporter permease [Candidatus Zymogenaceae bacterium]